MPSGHGEQVRSTVGLVARLLLAGVFAVAGIAKLRDLDVAELSVKSYRLLPDGVAGVVGIVLPLVEVVLAVLLLVGFGTRIAAAIVALLLVAFIIGIASLWWRGLSVGCGCFGSSLLAADSPPSYALEIVRDTGLLVAAGWLVVRPRSLWSLDSRLNQPTRTMRGT